MKNSVINKIRLSAGAVFLFAIISLMGSCEKAGPDSPGPDDNPGGSKGPGLNEVFIVDMAYNPSTITVTANTTITWTNKDMVAHTVTSDTDLFDSGSMGTGSTFSYTFTTAGTYNYYCTPHPSMVATVKVN